MLLRRLLATLFILFTATASRWKDDSVGKKSSEIIGRFFPILPPYHGVDFGANFNKLKSTGDAAYFVVRDSIVFVGVNLMWAMIHLLMWDGKAASNADILQSVLSPGLRDEPATESSDNSRLGLASLSELSPTKLWNFFTDPNPSTRNLYLNIGFGVASHILWILPTFLGIIPETQERFGSSLPGHLSEANPVTIWNRLLSPQGVLQIMAINTLNYLGKILFWSFMALAPDAPSGRSLQSFPGTSVSALVEPSLPQQLGWLGKVGAALLHKVNV